MSTIVKAGVSPEGGEGGRAAAEVLPIKASHAQAEGALAGQAITQRIAPIAPVLDAYRICVKTPNGRLESTAALPPLVAKLIARLQGSQPKA